MTQDNARWAARFQAELTGDILPFWSRHAVDEARGGFHGKIDCAGKVVLAEPRSAVLNTRILWTYAAACREFGSAYRELADRAFRYVADRFVDPVHGGIFWMLDPDSRPIDAHKQIYAQAFAIYALSEYYRATGVPESLTIARELYRLIEAHGRDLAYGGYIEARNRSWGALEDQRLSEKDLNAPKSMNTHLHVLEAYTNLLRVWPDPALAASQTRLLEAMLDHIVDASTAHFQLFFEMDWRSVSTHVSYGHDIEGTWLLCEAAEVLNDATLIERTHTLAVKMAQAVYEQGLDTDGSIFYESDGHGHMVDPKKHWWAQAEAVVGFYNAWQLSGAEHFRTAAVRLWDYIETHVVDHVHGEWYAKLAPDGRVLPESEDADACLVGPWKCPYHNTRACLEMLRRLKA
jgi:mannobiose 2-epimerase